MPDKNIQLTTSLKTLIAPCIIYTTMTMLSYSCFERTRLTWILSIALGIVSVYHWVLLLIGETILLISNEGMKYEGKMIRWEQINQFETVTYEDSETGNNTYLVLKVSNSYLDVNINITRLDTDKMQIREWIQMYSTLPADIGHRTTST
jgi:hypothetical protein